MTLLMRDQENIEKGKIEGIKEERRKIIIKMLSQGFTDGQIMSLCDTTEKEINDCRKQL